MLTRERMEGRSAAGRGGGGGDSSRMPLPKACAVLERERVRLTLVVVGLFLDVLAGVGLAELEASVGRGECTRPAISVGCSSKCLCNGRGTRALRLGMRRGRPLTLLLSPECRPCGGERLR